MLILYEALKISFWALFLLNSIVEATTDPEVSNITCYNPDGSRSSYSNPCDTTGKYSHCCQSEEQCLTNGLCIEDDWLAERRPWFWREACVDQEWGSACPQFCIGRGEDTIVEASTEDWPVIACSATEYCCAQDDEFGGNMTEFECCNDQTRIHTLDAAVLLNGSTINTFSFPTAFPAVVSSPTPASTAAQTTAQTIPSDHKDGPNSAAGSSSTTGLSPEASAFITQGATGLSYSAKVEIGVVVPLVTICIALLAALLWVLSKKQSQKRRQYEAAQMANSGAITYYIDQGAPLAEIGGDPRLGAIPLGAHPPPQPEHLARHESVELSNGKN